MKFYSTTLNVALLVAALALSACGGGSGNSAGNNGNGNSAINWPAAPSWPASAPTPAAPDWPAASGNGSSNSNSTPGTNVPANTANAPADGPASITPVSGPNTATITVDGKTSINQPYVTVTVCAPGAQGNSQCVTVNRMILDTGSTGVRVVASALGKAFAANLPAQTGATDDPSGSAPIVQCSTFGSGFTWGSIKQAIVAIGGETSGVMPMQVIGDGAFATPADCIARGGPDLSTVTALGANGLVGISNLVRDDPDSATRIYPAAYYYCTGAATCTNTRVPLSSQAMNPVAGFSSDNNGTIIRLPSVPPTGAATATGQLIFGIGTQQNNVMPANVHVVPLDQYGTFTSVYKNHALNPSVIDSGTNVLLFPDSTIPTATADGFYVPPSPLTLSAIFRASNGVGTPINIPFGIANANTLWASGNSAFNNIGAKGSGIVLWGLPFFYGRSVYTVLENASVGSLSGPFEAF
jgi:hypothetical protein